MRFFLLYFGLRCKEKVSAPFFWGMLALLAAVGGLLGMSLPSLGGGVQVGVCLQPDDPFGGPVWEILSQNEDYSFVLYPPAQHEQMQTDLLQGRLHCAYALEPEAHQTLLQGIRRPLATAYVTGGSYLASMADEAFLSACYQAAAPYRTAVFLQQLGRGDLEQLLPWARGYIAGRLAGGDLLRPQLVSPSPDGQAPLADTSGPLVPALVSTVLLALLALERLLAPQNAADPLLRAAGRGLAAWCAAAAATFLQGMLWLLPALAMAGLGGAFSAGGMRLAAAAAALVSWGMGWAWAFGRVARRLPAGGIALLPVGLLANFALSGAALSSQLLPAGLQLAQWLCPSWIFLRCLGLVG